MKQATFLVIGLLTTLMFLALACGGDDATAKPRPRATATVVAAATTPPAAATAVPTATTPSTAPTEAKLEISVKGDALEFDTDSFTVDAGAQVTLTFTNVSTAFQHNWVLTLDGTKDDVAQRGTLHATTDWVQPDDPDVVAHTKLLDMGTGG